MCLWSPKLKLPEPLLNKVDQIYLIIKLLFLQDNHFGYNKRVSEASAVTLRNLLKLKAISLSSNDLSRQTEAIWRSLNILNCLCFTKKIQSCHSRSITRLDLQLSFFYKKKNGKTEKAPVEGSSQIRGKELTAELQSSCQFNGKLSLPARVSM